jgi:hypothetical protein
MRFLVKLIIGMLLFNAFIVIFAQFIPNESLSPNAKNITGEYGGYKAQNMGSAVLNALNPINNPDSSAIFILLMATGGLAGVLSGRNTPMYLGIALILGLIIYIFNGTVKIFVLETNKYPVVSTLFSVMLIVIGIIAILSIGDILTGRSDVS